MKGSWAIITGASSGFGWALAERLAGRRMNLILTARREERLQELKKRIAAKHDVQIETLVFDVRHFKECEAALASKAALLDETSVLINNAGLAKGMESIATGNPHDWDQMIDTNIKGLLYMTRLVLPHMIKRNRGHIVNLGSVAGRWVLPNTAVYCATKFAVRAISDALRMDLMGTRIRVTNMAPGIAETEFAHVRFGDNARADAVYRGIKPLSAGEIAEAIVWCLEQPEHVDVHEMVVFPTAQANVGAPYLHREPH